MTFETIKKKLWKAMTWEVITPALALAIDHMATDADKLALLDEDGEINVYGLFVRYDYFCPRAKYLDERYTGAKQYVVASISDLNTEGEWAVFETSAEAMAHFRSLARHRGWHVFMKEKEWHKWLVKSGKMLKARLESYGGGTAENWQADTAGADGTGIAAMGLGEVG